MTLLEIADRHPGAAFAVIAAVLLIVDAALIWVFRRRPLRVRLENVEFEASDAESERTVAMREAAERFEASKGGKPS